MELEDVVYYGQIAEMMKVSPKSVKVYRFRDPNFPKPVTPPEARSPGFLRQDVEEWIRNRPSSKAGTGRPPRVAPDDVS